MVEKMENILTANLYFKNMVVVGDKLVMMSIDQMLLNTYKMYLQASENMLKGKIDDCSEKIKELNDLEKIRPYLAECIKANMDMDKTIKETSKQSKVSDEIIRGLITKYTISKLLSYKIDIKAVEDKQKEYQSNLKKIDKFVLSNYETFIERMK